MAFCLIDSVSINFIEIITASGYNSHYIKGKLVKIVLLLLISLHLNASSILLKKNERCAQCGMYVVKYPTFITQMVQEKQRYSFDGVKDMMKFYFKHPKKNTLFITKDYYSQKVLDAKKAYFVVGSNVYGPMGKELISFQTLDAAKNFKNDHFGKIVTFQEITLSLLKSD